jgi:hypothetical protein
VLWNRQNCLTTGLAENSGSNAEILVSWMGRKILTEHEELLNDLFGGGIDRMTLIQDPDPVKVSRSGSDKKVRIRQKGPDPQH